MKQFVFLEFNEFLEQFSEKMSQLLDGKKSVYPKWLRSADVRELLNISDSTLQTMRIGGTIPAYKLGSSWFYKYEEIIDALEAGKIGGKNG